MENKLSLHINEQLWNLLSQYIKDISDTIPDILKDLIDIFNKEFKCTPEVLDYTVFEVYRVIKIGHYSIKLSLKRLLEPVYNHKGKWRLYHLNMTYLDIFRLVLKKIIVREEKHYLATIDITGIG